MPKNTPSVSSSRVVWLLCSLILLIGGGIALHNYYFYVPLKVVWQGPTDRLLHNIRLSITYPEDQGHTGSLWKVVCGSDQANFSGGFICETKVRRGKEVIIDPSVRMFYPHGFESKDGRVHASHINPSSCFDLGYIFINGQRVEGVKITDFPSSSDFCAFRFRP